MGSIDAHPAVAQWLEAWLGHALDEIALDRIALVASLLGARSLGLLLVAPWFAPLRHAWLAWTAFASMWLAALLPFSVDGLSPGVAQALFASDATLMVALVRELLVGAAFAFIAGLPLMALQWSGLLLDGALSRAPLDAASAPLPSLYRWLGLVTFFALGGAELTVSTFAESLQAFPLGARIERADLQLLVVGSAGLVTHAIAFGALMVMPALLGSLILDAAHALSERFVPRLSSATLWLPLRHVATLVLVCLSLALVAGALPDAYVASMDQARGFMHAIKRAP